MLEVEQIEYDPLAEKSNNWYSSLKNPRKALVRDLIHLNKLKAISIHQIEDGRFQFLIRLEWPSEITEGEFFQRLKELPKAKTHSFLSREYGEEAEEE